MCALQRHKVKTAPLWAWIFSGISAPLAHVAGQSSWLAVLIFGAVCSVASYCTLVRADKYAYHAGWYSAVQTLWIAVVSGVVAQWSVQCWPTAHGFPMVGVTLLVLAVFTAWDGAERASRCTGVLFWLLALLYAVILAAGTQNLKMRYMAPTIQSVAPLIVMLLLIPATASFLPCEKRASVVPLTVIALFGTVVALWTVGTLSPNVTTRLPDPFYTFTRSLSLFGVAERFESLASVALTMGYFSLLTLMLCCVYHLTDSVFPEKGKTGVTAAAGLTLVIMISGAKVPELILSLGSVLLWILLPIFLPRKQKKVEK